MTSAVMQAGFAPAPSPQGKARSEQDKDAAASAFSDAMRSGEKGQGKTGPSAAEQRPEGAGKRFRPAPHAISQTWQAAAKTEAETVAEGEDPAEHMGWQLEAHGDRKGLKKSADTQARNADDVKDNEDEKVGEAGEVGQADTSPLPAITLLLDTIRRGIDPGGQQAAGNSANNLSVAEALAAAAAGSAGTSLKSMKTGTTGAEPTDTAAVENAVVTDAEGTAAPTKAVNRIAVESSDLPSQPGASTRETDQQTSETRTDRASPDSPRTSVRETTRDARQSEPSGANAKVGVVSMQSVPAPAANATTAAFMEAVSADPIWKSAAPETASQLSSQARPQPGAVHSLKIQLHPAELGMVTAELRFAGEQLSVELKVESAEAYHRLSSDTETIVKAFRALGYEIDQVTIQQPQTSSQAARTDAADASSGALARDPQSAFSGNTGDGGTRSGGRGSNAQGGSDGRHADGGGTMAQDRSSGSLYI